MSLAMGQGNLLYDDPAVIAGQGTIELEIARHAPWCDSVAVSVGGGGLAAGLSVSLGPDRPVVAVEPKCCNSLHAAFSAGGPVDGVATNALSWSSVPEAGRAAASALNTVTAAPATTRGRSSDGVSLNSFSVFSVLPLSLVSALYELERIRCDGQVYSA
jgi:hypothetical protein